MKSMAPIYKTAIDISGLFCLLAYFYSSYRKQVGSGGMEFAVNFFLWTGLALTFFLSMQVNFWAIWLFIDLPVNILFALALMDNYKKGRMDGNKIPRGSEEEVKRPQPGNGIRAQAADLQPGTEFLEDIWETDEGKR